MEIANEKHEEYVEGMQEMLISLHEGITEALINFDADKETRKYLRRCIAAVDMMIEYRV